MMNPTALLLVPAALLVAALTGCSDNQKAATQTAAPSTSASPRSAPTPAVALAVKDTNLGQIIVDGTGMTAYVFDQDVAGSGKSACAGDCQKIWLAVPASSDQPAAQGITAAVGVITGEGGVRQVTVAGLPVYTFANDKSPGDTKGQLVKGLWHAVTASGQKVG